MDSFKVAIVGAGVSGLYAAWRLCVESPTLDPKDIVILEQSQRTGGRLFTWTLNDFDPSIPADPAVRAELGGMRILNYNLYAYSLALELGLELAPFLADVPQNWHFLRREVLQTRNYPQQTAYSLAEAELGWTPGDVIFNSLVTNGKIVPEDQFPSDSITQRRFVDWVMANSIFNGNPAYQYGLWNILEGSGQHQVPNASNVSQQAYSFFVEAGAYDTIPSNWNASVAISNALSDFSNNPTYWAVKDGYEQIPNRMAAGLKAANPDMIRLGASVTNLNYAGGKFALEINGGAQTVAADKVVLALPPRALQILSEKSGGLLADQKPKLAQSTPIPLLKIFLVYEEDWWRDAIGDWPVFTRMTTNLPMRQVYNFGSQEVNGKTYHLLQAAYNDGLKAGYWSGLIPSASALRNQDVDTTIFGRIINNSGPTTLETGLLSFNTDDSVYKYPLFVTIHQQLVALVEAVASGKPVTPKPPIAGATMDWATDPFGGGVNFWNVGVNVAKAYDEMMHPVTAVPMFIIGEGYSLYQGWVEGALWSAEDMLEKFFQLGEPKWLKKTPYRAPGGRPPAIAAGIDPRAS